MATRRRGKRSMIKVDWQSHVAPDLRALGLELGRLVREEIEARAEVGEHAGGRNRRLKRATVERYARDGISSDRTARFRRTGRTLNSLHYVLRAVGRKLEVVLRVGSRYEAHVAILANQRRPLLGLPRRVAAEIFERARTAARRQWLASAAGEPPERRR